MAASQHLSLSDVIWQDKGRMSGAPCFKGTRIRVQDFFDWIKAGSSVDEFAKAYPHVPREGLLLVLQAAEDEVLRHWKAA